MCFSLRNIDIGGGLPINYESDEHKPSFYDYVGLLEHEIPELFSNEYNIYTEFGRSLIQKCGFIASKVEYVKSNKYKNIAITHCGANLMLRTAY